jgi:hypothetical protein
MVGANDHGDEAQNGLWSFLSKHSHCGGDREKLHSPRPAQLAGHIDLRVALSSYGEEMARELASSFALWKFRKRSEVSVSTHSGQVCAKDGQTTLVPLGSRNTSPAYEHVILFPPPTIRTNFPASSPYLPQAISKHNGLCPLAC